MIFAPNQETKPHLNMLKYILPALFLFSVPGFILSQHSIKGIALKKFDNIEEGDTINIYGYKQKSGGEAYLVRSGYGDKYVSSKKVRLLDEGMGYWQKIWLQNQASHIRSNGWQTGLRTNLREDYYEYAAQMEINNLVFRDEYLEDYLKQLIYVLHPEPLLKQHTSRLNILMIRANQPESFVFDNGTIVITTGMIARTNTERELMQILSKQTAHIVLDHNLMNINHEVHSQRSAEFWSTFATLASAVAMEFSNIQYGTNFNVGDVVLAGLTSAAISDAIVMSSGSNFDAGQQQKAKTAGNDFINGLDGDPDFHYLSDKEYMINISSILSLTAWQEYHHNNYDRSMFYMDRIFSLGIANEEDYLLKAKLKRTLSNSTESNLEALQLINTALAMNDFNYVEGLAEKGLILIRLNQVEEARDVFVQYKAAASGLTGLPPGRDIAWANRMVIKCDQLMLKR